MLLWDLTTDNVIRVAEKWVNIMPEPDGLESRLSGGPM
jgi:hypothetical protein